MRHKNTVWLIWLLAVGTAATDIFTTFIGLNVGLVERNPIGSYFIDEFGMASMLIFKIAVLAVAYVCAKVNRHLIDISDNLDSLEEKNDYIAPSILAFIWGSASVWNAYHIVLQTGAI